MQSTSVTPWHTCYYYIPKHFPSNHSLHFHKKPLVFPSNFSHIPTRCTNNSFVLSSTHNCYQEQEKHKNNSDPDRLNNIFWQEFYPSVENEKPHQRKDSEEQETAVITRSSIRTNSWWARFKAALGQRINVEGIACFTGILYKNKNLAIPNVFVPDIRYIDWAELKKRGFEGVVFDKDNTITVPYSLNLWSPLASSIGQCKSLFGDNIAVFSNSAGNLIRNYDWFCGFCCNFKCVFFFCRTKCLMIWEFVGLDEYDPDGRKARILERAIGIKVIMHSKLYFLFGIPFALIYHVLYIPFL